MNYNSQNSGYNNEEHKSRSDASFFGWMGFALAMMYFTEMLIYKGLSLMHWYGLLDNFLGIFFEMGKFAILLVIALRLRNTAFKVLLIVFASIMLLYSIFSSLLWYGYGF